MKPYYLSLCCLLLSPAPTNAADPAELTVQRDRLRHEVQQIQQTTRDERARMDALKALIDAQREQNRLLDQQLDTEITHRQQKTLPGNKSSSQKGK